MPKSSKKFILTNSLLNSYGFRLLTGGADLKEFRQNPIMLWMHNRALRGNKDEVLPLGYWDDIRVEGDDITAVPVFDDNDAFAMAIYHKVENGTIRTCSAGAVPLAFSEERKDLLPGQTRPTVTRWKLKEASLTDIGSNPGALAVALYDEQEQLITLSDQSVLDNFFPEINLSNMKIFQLSAADLALKLKKETATEEEALAAIENLVTLADTLTGENTTLKTEREQLQTKLTDLEKAATAEKITALVDKAVLDRKITAADKEVMVKLAEKDFDSVKAYLEKLPANPTVQVTLATAAATGATASLADKTWEELFASGKLEELKLNQPELFKLKYKAKFGKEYSK